MIRTGPQAYTVPDFSGLAVAALAAGEPGDSGVFTFRWPRPVFWTGLIVVPRGDSALGSPEVEQANLAIEIQDEQSKQIITDTRGADSLRVKPFAAPALAMAGLRGQVFPFQRPIGEDVEYRFRVRNYAAVAITIAAVMLFFDEAAAR